MTKKDLKNIIYTAVFAAIICATTMTVRIPAAGGYYHIGDAFIYLAGVCLSFPYAWIAAAIGGSFADLFSGYFAYMLPTFIIKACIAACFTNKKAKILCRRNFIAIIAASVITIVGYGTVYVIFYGLAGLANLYGDLGQILASAVIFIAAGAAIDKTNIREKIFK